MSTSAARGIQSVACGQLVSIFSMASLIMAKYLALRDVSTPAFLNCCFYAALSILCFSLSFRQQGKWLGQQLSAGQQAETPFEYPVLTPVNSPGMGDEGLDATAAKRSQGQQQTASEPRWWAYTLVAFFDLQANCLAVRSLAFTDYASVGLMLNLTIPFILLLSYVTFDSKYSWRHTAGCATAVVGGFVIFVSSGLRDHTDENSQQLFGCFVALAAALMYGASNIANQLFLAVQGVDRVIENLGKIAAWGAGLALIQMIVLERTQVFAIVWTQEVAICFVAHVLAILSFYVLVSMLPRPTTASPLYSLAILASNLYLALVSHYLFAEDPRGYFFAALVLVVAGLSIHCVEHSLAAKKQQEQSKKVTVSFGSMHTPTQIEHTTIQIEEVQIEQAAL